MAVLIDPPAWPAHGRLWSHLVSDTSLAELHAFAAAAGIPRRGFEGDHYDVPEERYGSLVAAGARPVAGRELLRRLVDSGLRVPKRRGERVLSSGTDPRWPHVAHRFDVLASPLPTPMAATVGAVLLAGDGAGRLLLVPAGDGWDAPSATTLPGEAVSAAGARAARDGGLDVEAGALVPAGQERLRLLQDPPPGWPRPAPWSYRAVFTTVLPTGAAGVPAGATAGRWTPRDEARARVGHLPWWPLAERLSAAA